LGHKDTHPHFLQRDGRCLRRIDQTAETVRQNALSPESGRPGIRNPPS
jgi:hypothetical protein